MGLTQSLAASLEGPMADRRPVSVPTHRSDSKKGLRHSPPPLPVGFDSQVPVRHVQTNFPWGFSTSQLLHRQTSPRVSTQQHSPPLSRTPPLTLSLVATARSRYTPPTAPFPSALGLTPFATSVHAPVAIGGIGIGARARLTGDPGGGSRRCSIVREAYATATGTRTGPLRGVYSHGLRQLS
jgi:hypothetical protein